MASLTFWGLRVFSLMYLLLHNPVPYQVYAGVPQHRHVVSSLEGVHQRSFKKRSEEETFLVQHMDHPDGNDDENVLIRKRFISVATAISLTFFVAGTICNIIVLSNFDCGSLEHDVCDKKNQVIRKRDAAIELLTQTEEVKNAFVLKENLYQQMLSRYNKIVADIDEVIDIVTKYVGVFNNIKSQNLTIPSVPDSFLNLITAYNDTLTQINTDISGVSTTAINLFHFVYGVVTLGLSFLRYVAQFSFWLHGYTTMPTTAMSNVVEVNYHGTVAKYGWSGDLGKNTKIYKVGDDGIPTETAGMRHIAAAKGVKMSNWQTIRYYWDKFQARFGIALSVIIGLVSLGICIWHAVEIKEKAAEAIAKLDETKKDIANLTTEMTATSALFVNYTAEVQTVIDNMIEGTDNMTDIIIASEAFNTSTINASQIAAMQTVASTTLTEANIVSNMDVIVDFLEHYRVDVLGSYQAAQTEVTVASAIRADAPSADMVRSVQNLGITGVTQFSILEKVAVMSKSSTWDSVPLNCIKDGSINSQEALDAYVAKLAAAGLYLTQNVIKDIKLLADTGIYPYYIIQSVKSQHGIVLTKEQVLKIIANLDEWKNEAVYPKLTLPPEYGGSTITFDLTSYRSTAPSC